MMGEFLLYGGAFLSFVFMLHLFTYKLGNLLLNRLLGLLFLLRFLNNIVFIHYSMQLDNQYNNLILFIEALLFLSPALCYLYIRTFLFDETKLKAWDLLHAIPFVLLLLSFIILFTSNPSNFQHTIIFKPEFKLYLLAIGSGLFITYLFYCFRIFFRVIKNENNQINEVSKKWLFLMFGLAGFANLLKFVLSILVLVKVVSLSVYFNSNGLQFISSLSTTVFIIFILRNPHVLYGNLIPKLKIDLQIKNEKETSISDLAEENTVAVSSELLEIEQMKAYHQLIENYMKEELPYLDPYFNISQLSEKLNIPVHHCSFVLNQGLGKNFREYINKFRIDYFIAEYPSRISSQTLESIASVAGFKSSSTFYAAFKKETGTSPTNYFS